MADLIERPGVLDFAESTACNDTGDPLRNICRVGSGGHYSRAADPASRDSSLLGFLDGAPRVGRDIELRILPRAVNPKAERQNQGGNQ